MKNRLFEYLNEHLKAARERYDALVQAPEKIEGALLEGAETARTYARPFLNQLRNSVGIRALGSSG
jgi:tryptophanyl-tRNA synthetase